MLHSSHKCKFIKIIIFRKNNKKNNTKVNLIEICCVSVLNKFSIDVAKKVETETFEIRCKNKTRVCFFSCVWGREEQ